MDMYQNTTNNNTVDYAGKSTECDLFPDEPSYCVILVVCKRVACVISIIGVILTLAIIVLFKKYREFTQRLIANLCIASLLSSVCFVMSDFESTSPSFCVFQGALMTYLIWAILLGSMSILASLYFGIIVQKDLRKYEKQLLIVCWVLPILFAGLPFSDDVYGPAGAWCWMKNKWGWRFGIWYIWKVISDIVFFVAIIWIWYTLLRKPEVNPAQRNEMLDEIKTLRAYPVVYFLIFLLPTINRIYNAADHTDGQKGYSFPLLLLHSITAPLFGACVALTFALDTRTRRLLRQEDVLMEIKKKWRRSGRVKEYKPHQRALDTNVANLQEDTR